jgi:hypothetical protein
LEKKEANSFVLCDFSKAFDKVWHRGLSHKMKAYEITGNVINWNEVSSANSLLSGKSLSAISFV